MLTEEQSRSLAKSRHQMRRSRLRQRSGGCQIRWLRNPAREQGKLPLIVIGDTQRPTERLRRWLRRCRPRMRRPSVPPQEVPAGTQIKCPKCGTTFQPAQVVEEAVVVAAPPRSRADRASNRFRSVLLKLLIRQREMNREPAGRGERSKQDQSGESHRKIRNVLSIRNTSA